MDKVEELQAASIDELLKFFNGPQAVRESKDSRFSSNLAVKTLAAVGRVKATDRARDSMQLTVLKSIATDKKDFQKYVQASMPHLSPVRQIAAKKPK